MSTICIERRFRGPPDSGNGGYFAGLLAREWGGNALITLKKPAPLDVELRIERDGGEARLLHGDELLATGEQAALDIAVPEPPNVADARAAEERFDREAHVYPGCFVCGPQRAKGDGWRIFPGPIGVGRVAASWTPAAEFAGEDGNVKPEFVWAALDCPGYFAVQDRAGLALLGRMGAAIRAPVRARETLVVQAWDLGSEGRKHRAGTAIHAADGRLLAAAEQLWISLR